MNHQLQLAPDQTAALRLILGSRVSVLCGAPGTGKTTALRAAVDKLEARGQKVVLAAPTGKAARRMMEQTGRPASTIHRLLGPEKTPVGWAFKFGPPPRPQLSCDVLILDETSMLDVHLARAVLTALPPTARVVLVGDPHQLPSVGCGLVLQDVIESGMIPVAKLTSIKRQNPGALVLALHSILHGRVPDISNAPTDDLQFVARETPEEIRETVLALATRQLPAALPRILERAPEDCDGLRDIQIITPTRERGELSCAALNAAMQAHYAPAVDGPSGKARLRVGDKVIQCRNDYELGLVNGDVGFVRELVDEVADNGRKRKVLRCSFDALAPDEPEREAAIPAAENDLVLAYAVTCHKYQGSEAPIIVIPIHHSMPSVLLTRNWVYTAMSRAARLCVVVGSWGAFRAAVRRVAPTQRKTGLREMLQAAGAAAAESR